METSYGSERSRSNDRPSKWLRGVAPDDPEGRDLVGRFVGVSLEVPDIEATHKALVERGVDFLAAPKKQPWGGVLAHLRDPDGNVITLLGASE